MDIFDIIELCGGLAFFLFGMNTLSSNLETMVGGKLESLLKKMTSNPFKSLLLGAGITIAIQSSSAMTVMLVGLVNSGIMEFAQTIGIIMGSNIGTTLTVWILSATGMEGGNLVTQLMKPESFSPIVALIGAGMIMFAKSDKKKNVGAIMIGFALLMSGMSMMSSSVSGLRDEPFFADVMTMFNNPFAGVLVGTVITAIIQSSAASMGILQSLALTGVISYNMALPIIMGQNIGTCVTALLSSVGTNKGAKRVTAIHISFNVIGTVVCLAGFYGADAIFNFAFTDSAIDPVGIAFVHTCFNVINTVILLPFAKQLAKLAEIVVKDDKSGRATKEEVMLDERLLISPSLAIAESRNCTVRMAELVRKTLLASIEMMKYYDPKADKMIEENEHQIDVYEDKLGSYLVMINSKNLSHTDSNDIAQMLHTIGDLERIGDHSLNILKIAREINSKKLNFSEKATAEIEVFTQALKDIVNITFNSFEKHDDDLAYKVEPLEQVIDLLGGELKSRHIKRLQDGKCTIELGFVLSDIITNFRRISDHCSNIAVYQIQIDHDSMETHEYLDNVKAGEPLFLEYFDKYKKTYHLPLSVSSPDKAYQPVENSVK